MRNFFALVLISCATPPPPVAPAQPSKIILRSVPIVPAAPIAAAVTANPPYMIGIRSVVFAKTTVLRKEPRADAVAVGIIRGGTRAGVAQAVAAGAECRTTDGADGRWIEIVPRGWTCETAIEPSTDEPTTAVAASFADDDAPSPIRGVYGFVHGAQVEAFGSRADAAAQTNGRVLAGSNTVRASGVVDVDGRRFWRTTQGALIDEASIAQISPSKFKGVAIGDGDSLPAWVRSHRDPYKAAVTYATAAASHKLGELAPRTVVTIREESGRFVRIDDTAWIERADLRVATLAAPPPGTAPDEKWFDIDRDEQVLVAYEGARPVYATLVSTGKYQHETPTTIARVVSKLESAVMTSDKESIYSVADVPWTMYYDRDFALHTSYWHDGFGSPRSHGCVNLAPRDAQALYRWSSPDVPPGWIAVYGDADNPGSLVRVRSRAVPEPAFRGYARAMHEVASLDREDHQ